MKTGSQGARGQKNRPHARGRVPPFENSLPTPTREIIRALPSRSSRDSTRAQTDLTQLRASVGGLVRYIERDRVLSVTRDVDLLERWELEFEDVMDELQAPHRVQLREQVPASAWTPSGESPAAPAAEISRPLAGQPSPEPELAAGSPGLAAAKVVLPDDVTINSQTDTIPWG